MDEHRTLPVPRRCLVIQIEDLGQVEIDLHGRKGFLAPARVRDLNIDLGAVEGRRVGRLHPRHTGIAQHGTQPVLGHTPHVGLVDVPAARPAQRQPQPVVSDSQHPVDVLEQFHHLAHLRRDRIGRHEDVRVVEGHGADPAEPTDHAGTFASEHGAQLRQPDGHVPEAVVVGYVTDLSAARTPPEYDRISRNVRRVPCRSPHPTHTTKCSIAPSRAHSRTRPST
jgi:hypothetical protein